MNIQKKIKNDLFNREEIVFEVNAGKNPSFEEMKNLLSEKTGKPAENINVLRILGSFGEDNFIVNAYVYDSKDDLDKAVQKSRKQRREEKKAELEAKKKAAEEASSAKS